MIIFNNICAYLEDYKLDLRLDRCLLVLSKNLGHEFSQCYWDLSNYTLG